MRKTKKSEIDVNCDLVKEWLPGTKELLASCPQHPRRVIRNPALFEFVKCWWRYGIQGTGKDGAWIERALKHNALSPDGIVALECLHQGRAGVPWMAVVSAFELEAEFPAYGSKRARRGGGAAPANRSKGQGEELPGLPT